MPGRRAAHRPREELTGPGGATTGRLVAFGDPQGPAARLRAVLARHGLLGDDGRRVRAGARLLSLGDHFDYPPPAGAGTGSGADAEAGVAAREGVELLSWLAGEPDERVVILLGNHDACRVVELIGLADEGFALARRLAREIADAGETPAAARGRERFAALFPDVPTPDVVLRDFSSYCDAQRRLVQSLLLAGRFRLAHAARLKAHPDVEVLLTHAGVTERELALLALGGERRPRALAAALNALLDRAVARVRPRWLAGERVPLDLAPLHVAGRVGAEGGGLLYHRPADPESEGDAAWRFDPERPRRFDPRRLPRGLVQACGHTAHARTARELARWVADDAPAAEGRDLRLLAVTGDEVRYARWDGERPPTDPRSAALLLLDAGLHRAAPESVPLLELIDEPGARGA